MQVLGIATLVGSLQELRRDPWVLGRVGDLLVEPVFAHRPGYAEINHGNLRAATAYVNTNVFVVNIIMNEAIFGYIF